MLSIRALPNNKKLPIRLQSHLKRDNCVRNSKDGSEYTATQKRCDLKGFMVCLDDIQLCRELILY